MGLEIWMGNLFSQVIDSVPAIGFGGSLPSKLERAFGATGQRTDARKYLSAALFFSLIVAAAAFIAFAFFADALLALACSLFSFALLFFCISNYPMLNSSRLEEAYASEMPLMLRQAAVYQSIGIPPEKSLELLSESGYLFSAQLRIAVMQIKSGAPLSRALTNLSAKFPSRPVKSAISALAFAYSHGSGQEMLRSLADNLSSEALSTVRLFSSRSSILFLVFIAVSALLPAFFGIYAVLSAGILKESMGDGVIFGAYLVAFPLLDVAALFALIALRPPMLSSQRGSAAGRVLGGSVALFSREVPSIALLAASAFFAILAGLAFLLQMPALCMLLAFLFCIFLAPVLYGIYESESQSSAMEKMLPGALFEVSYLQQTASAEKWIEKIAAGNYGRLSLLFAECSRKISAGASIPSALGSIASGSDSAMLSRSCTLISHAYMAGGPMHRALSETAQDILSTFSLISEREAALSLQKYTLLFGGGVLVPLILGIVHGMASSLGKFPGAAGGAEGISAAIPLATGAYLIIYSLISSIAIGHGEGQRGNWPVYFGILAPLSLLLYHLAAGFSLF
jgi:Flp pilus assembly protein TadB